MANAAPLLESITERFHGKSRAGCAVLCWDKRDEVVLCTETAPCFPSATVTRAPQQETAAELSPPRAAPEWGRRGQLCHLHSVLHAVLSLRRNVPGTLQGCLCAWGQLLGAAAVPSCPENSLPENGFAKSPFSLPRFAAME